MRRPWWRAVPVVEATLAACAATLSLFGVAAEFAASPAPVPPRAIGYALTVAASAVLVLRRRFPLPVGVAALALVLAYHLAGFPGLGLAIAVFVADYTVAAYGRSAWSLAATSLLVAGVSVIPLLPPHATPATSPSVYGPAVGLLCVAVLGATVRRRRLDSEDRVRHERAAAEAEMRHRLVEDRIRIARELHDVLAHTISAITVQGGLALDALDDSPEVTRAALLTMRGCAREALAELRVALHALRGEEHPEASTLPQPRLAQLAGLTAQAESAGIRVHLSQPGAGTLMPVDGSLPPVLELTAYRIVQEALTNAVRHSGAGNLWVQLCRDGTHLIIDVSDDGRGLPPGPGTPAEGLGLRGMRERAESLGGTLHCGPSDVGGCRILARLPL